MSARLPSEPLDSMSDFKYGEHIREARQRLGLSQEAFAHALNVSPRTVARWEADDSTPHSASHRVDLAHAFVAANMEDLARKLNPALDGVLSEERLLGFLPDNAAAKALAVGAAIGALPGALPFGALSALGAAGVGLFANRKQAQTQAQAKTSAEPEGPQTPAAKAEDFARQAKVWEAVVTAAASSQIPTEIFTQGLMRLSTELTQRGLTLEDLRKVFR